MRSVMKRMMVIVMIVAVLTAQMPGKAAAAAKPIMMSLNYSSGESAWETETGCFIDCAKWSE